jgi:hypothetical protein
MWGEIIHSIEVSPPLYFLAAWLTHLPFGDHHSLRIPSLIAGVAVVPGLWFLARRVTGERAAWFAAVLAVLSPWAVYYAGEARPYSLLMLWGACLPLALLRAMERSVWQRWAVFAGVCLLGVYTHYTIIFAIIFCSAWAFAVQPSARKPLLCVAAAGFIGYLPWLFQISGKGNLSAYGHVWGRTTQWWGDSLGHAAVGLPYAGLADIPGWPLFAVLLGCIVLGLATQIGRGIDARSPLFLMWMMILAPAFGLALYAAVTNINLLGLRNWSSVWAAFPVVISVAVCRARPRKLAYVLMTATLVVFAAAAYQSSREQWQRPDVSGAAHNFDRIVPRDTVLFAEPGNRSSGYFSWPIPRIGTNDTAPSWLQASKQQQPVLIIHRVMLNESQSIARKNVAPGYRLVCSARNAGFFPVESYLFMPSGRSWKQACPKASDPARLSNSQRRRTLILAWANGSIVLPQHHPRILLDWLPIVLSLSLLLTLVGLARRRNN